MSQTSNDLPRERVETVELTESERFRLLAVDRRRVAISLLTDHEPPIDLEDLAALIAAREGAPDATRTEARERIAAELHHNHLPKLAEVGLVDYDPGSNRVRSSRL